MALSKQGQKAWKDLADSIAEKGANCVNPDGNPRTPDPWTGIVDAEGREWLPTPEEAKKLCAGCPQLGEECLEWKSKGDTIWGTLNGEVVDKWDLNGERS